MAHLNGHSLQRWGKGDQLRAADLNDNFAALRDMAEQAMAAALMPDPAAVGLELRFGEIEQRLLTLQAMTTAHSRQRNEMAWAPLAQVGAILTMVQELRRDAEAELARLKAALIRLVEASAGFERRLERVEQLPEAAALADFAEVALGHARLAGHEQMLLGQIVALRAEVMILREAALGRAREANAIEYAPLAYVGAILQRLAAVEARLG
jgi:hypothetical protein